MNAVSVKNLRVLLRSSGKPILDGISFDIGIGDRLALIGESGSGKSMTALSLLSLLPPSMKEEGIVHIGDTDMITAAERERNTVRGSFAAIVYQEPLTALDPLMTVGNQIAGPLKLHRRLTGTAARTEVFRLLDMVKLSDSSRIVSSYPYELSGGQRQRIAIAMALACSPRLLIADEPTTALDVTIQKDILALLDELVRDSGMSLLFITHDLAVAAKISERVAIMQKGKIVESGSMDDVLSRPAHPYTRQLLDAAVKVSTVPFLPPDSPETARGSV
ncbi:MAG TPA: ABC transporter ATP-binding protein [Treponema sp.]|nr:ABC transporter ATP-binding protein [Treponema sp.]